MIGNTRCSCSFPPPPSGCFSSYILLPISLLIHLGVLVPWLRARVEWGIRILYHVLRQRRGSSVSPRGSQNCSVCSGETPLQWHLPDHSATLVSTLVSDLPLPLCPWGCLAFLSASKFCPSYLLIKGLGVTGVEGAVEWQGKTKKQGCTGGQGQILGDLQCHADEFGRGPEDELNWVVTRLELCLEKIIEVDGCGKWMQGGQTNVQVGWPPGVYCEGPGREKWRPPLDSSIGSGKEKTAMPRLPWVGLRGLGWVWSTGEGGGDL